MGEQHIRNAKLYSIIFQQEFFSHTFRYSLMLFTILIRTCTLTFSHSYSSAYTLNLSHIPYKHFALSYSQILADAYQHAYSHIYTNIYTLTPILIYMYVST